MDEDLRNVERCLEEAIRIDNVVIEVDTIKSKLQRCACGGAVWQPCVWA